MQYLSRRSFRVLYQNREFNDFQFYRYRSVTAPPSSYDTGFDHVTVKSERMPPLGLATQ